ncbi:MAG: hypothetical protein ACE5H4_03950 [Candidatus Thorarchaeota archaeon]
MTNDMGMEPQTDEIPFYLGGPKSPAMFLILLYGQLNIVYGVYISSLGEIFAVAFILGGLLIAANVFSSPGGEFYLYGFLICAAITILWWGIAAGVTLITVHYLVVDLAFALLGTVCMLILVLRHWYGPIKLMRAEQQRESINTVD